MQRHPLRPLVAALMLSPLAASLAQAAPAGRVLMVTGDANVERGGQKIALKRGSLVEEGDRLVTGAGGSVQIMFTDQGLIALRENSVFKIDKFSFQQGLDAANFSLEKGGVRTVTGQVGKTRNKDYSLNAVVATIGIRGTNFELVLCDGQCGDSASSARNGLYGVVRGASGGTSRITISNDSGEKLLGKNDAFFVADRNSPAQQLVAPPSFVTARTEASRKTDNRQTSGDSKPDETKSGDTSKPDPGSNSSSSSNSNGTSNPSNTTTTSVTTTPPVATPLVPPPTNQSLLMTTNTFQLATKTPVFEGGSASTTPSGGSIDSSTAISPAPAPAAQITSSQAGVITYIPDAINAYLPHSSGGPSVTFTFASDRLSPTAVSSSKTYSYGQSGQSITQTTSTSLSQGVGSSVTVDGSTSANGLPEHIWGRWGGPNISRTETSGQPGGPSSSLSDLLANRGTNLHFVYGPILQNLPSSGITTYHLIGHTPPTRNQPGSDTQFGTLARGNGDPAFGSATTEALVAKVGYSFGTGGKPFLALTPFRIGDTSQAPNYVFVAGAGAIPQPGMGKPILFDPAGPTEAGGFRASEYGLYAGPAGNLSYNPSFSAHLEGQLLGNTGGGLGIVYNIFLSPSGATNFPVINGAMVFRKDSAEVATPNFSDSVGALSLASFVRASVGNDINAISSGLNSFGSATIGLVSAPTGGTPTSPYAFEANGSALTNFLKTSDATTPIMMDDSGGLAGYRWGRWLTPLVFGSGSDPNAIAGGAVVSLHASGQHATNLHFITGPELSALPATGFATYTLLGNTVPTARDGSTGTLSRADGSTAVSQMKASLALKFSADNSILPFLRIDSFRLTSSANSSDTLTVAGNASLIGAFAPIDLTLSSSGRFDGMTEKVYRTTRKNPSPRLAGGSATLQGQLMGVAGAGLGVSYRIQAASEVDGEPDGMGIGTMVFGRNATLTNRTISTTPAAFTSTALSLATAEVTHQSNDSALVTLHDNTPVGVVVPGMTSHGLVNFSGVAGTDIDGTDGPYAWGRWGKSGFGSIATTTNGVVDNQATVGEVHFLSGPPLANIPTTGTITYNLSGATLPGGTNGTAWQLQNAQGGPAANIATNVSFNADPTQNNMSMTPFKLFSTNTQAAVFVTGNTSLFSPGGNSLTPIQFSPLAGKPGAFTATGSAPGKVAAYDQNGSVAGSAQVNGQLMGNGANGLGITYSVTQGVDSVRGAMYLKHTP